MFTILIAVAIIYLIIGLGTALVIADEVLNHLFSLDTLLLLAITTLIWPIIWYVYIKDRMR